MPASMGLRVLDSDQPLAAGDELEPETSASNRPKLSVRYPLWLKLGTLFASIIVLLLAELGWVDHQEELQHNDKQRRDWLVGQAMAVAALLDGPQIASFRRQADTETEAYRTLVGRLRGIRHALGVRWIGIVGREGDRIYYVLDAEEEDPLPINYPIFDVYPQLSAAFLGKPGFGVDQQDEWGRWDSGYAPILGEKGAVVAVLELDMDADWREALAERRLRTLVVRLGVAALLALLVSILFARYLARHLNALARAAMAVADGQLDQHLEVRSRDEVGVVAATFNTMLEGLKERDFIRDAFGRYVHPSVARRVMADPEALKPGGDLRRVTLLMSDLRGFTSMSERSSPAQMIELLNDYLGRMSALVSKHEGTVLEFIGDAVMAVFGAPEQGEDDALRAVACAVEMQLELGNLNRLLEEREHVPLQMGVGVNTGHVIVGNIGSEARMKYGVVGDAVNMAARVESFTIGGEVLIGHETWLEVSEHVEARGPLEVRAKGKSEPLKVYSVLAVGEPHALLLPPVQLSGKLVEVQLAVECFLVEGKEVSEQPITGTLVRLGEDDAELLLDASLAHFADVMLRVQMPEGARSKAVDQIYAKVVQVAEPGSETPCRVHFTSVPPAAVEAFAPLIA